MKTKLLFLSMAMMSMFSSRSLAFGNSSLKLVIQGHGAFMVCVDDVWISGCQSEFLFNRLVPGNHHLVILKQSDGRGYHKGRRGNVLYDGCIRLAPGIRTFAQFDRYFGLQLTGEGFCSIPDCYMDELTMCPMRQDRFDALCAAIDSRNFESSRLEVALMALRGNSFSTHQIRRLLASFTFESSKLEFAKAAYGQTIDQDQYFRLYDVFVFDSSIHELNDFIAHA